MVYYYFTAEWCGPCKSIKPLVMASGRAVVVDVDTNASLAGKYSVRSVPTVIGANGDDVVERYSGVGQIQSWLNRK